MNRIKYAAVGTGGRLPMFVDPIAGRFRDSAELVGLCDPSEVRRTYHQQRLIRDFGLPPVPAYGDFSEMLHAQKPDVVIVCTPDYLHHEYIVRSLDFGADVISEKPLTTDAGRCREIFDAVCRTGGKVRTTFNMRWAPGIGKVREIIAAGTIGRVCHINFEYMLNTAHGADYFRRWHSLKECSGGLLVHKSTHHFDVINWWIDGIPSLVFALGDLAFYGKKNAVDRGDEAFTRYPRYTGVAAARDDPFALSMEGDPAMSGLYLQAEQETGYIRDRNVFREGITIEDSMSVLVKYRSGVMVNYSLNAFCPKEGFRASITGDRGRIEYVENHFVPSSPAEAKKKEPVKDRSMSLEVQKHFSEPYKVDIANIEGSHGGADPLLQEQLFAFDPPADSLRRNAGHEQGAASLLIGAAANQSMAMGAPVEIDRLLALNPEAQRLSDLI